MNTTNAPDDYYVPGFRASGTPLEAWEAAIGTEIPSDRRGVDTYVLARVVARGKWSYQYDAEGTRHSRALIGPGAVAPSGPSSTDVNAEFGGDSSTPDPPVDHFLLRDATPELANQLHVAQAWLQECIDLLNDRPQLIFYGPPGTGKTYIAQALAKHVAEDRVRLVQFHPSYSYEDFFEGYRPEQDGGFRLTPGPMRKIVEQAREHPDQAYVLIVDEINRGNLAKVFGELYFLLEYREESVELLYADGDFSLPRNVFLIGTMNTADRSIALVDAAMRRRFAFLPLHPSEAPTRDVLRSWLAREGHPARVADLLDELNRRIEDADFKIGPSYFMRRAVHADGGLERTWRTSILPLLEEHHFGEMDANGVGARYGLTAIEASLDKAVEVPNATSETD